MRSRSRVRLKRTTLPLHFPHPSSTSDYFTFSPHERDWRGVGSWSLRLVSGGFNSIHSSHDQSETSNPFPGTTQCPPKGPNAPQAWEMGQMAPALSQGSPGPRCLHDHDNQDHPCSTSRYHVQVIEPWDWRLLTAQGSQKGSLQDFNLFFRLHQPPSSVTALGLGWTGSGAAFDRRAILG